MYASLYIRLLSLSRYDTLQNVLYLIGEMLTGSFDPREDQGGATDPIAPDRP